MANQTLQGGSSALAGVSYDANQNTLTVSFTKGGRWVYFDVPAYKFEALKSAGSRGRYFNSNIRDNYSYARA